MKHGAARRGAKTPEYHVWVEMRARCRNPNHKRFADYGGRGITVSARWDRFDVFIADMGPRPTARHQLERKNNNGPYSKKNCRWATPKEQCNNTRRNIVIRIRGQKMTLAQAVEKFGCRYGKALRRYREGQSIEQALGINS